MKYMGSKSRISQDICPIIQGFIDEQDRSYYEPFCGGCNVIEHIIAKERFAADNQRYLIELYKNLHNVDQLPEFVTREHYCDVRNSYKSNDGKYADWYIGAVGFLASYNGRFFDGGYSGLIKSKSGVERNYYAEAKKNLFAQMPLLTDVRFICADYKDTINLHNFVVYCDPPYLGTKQYRSSKCFNHDEFWNWVREMSEDNIVIVSEHSAPNDFECIWHQNIVRTINNRNRIHTIEKLFIKRK